MDNNNSCNSNVILFLYINVLIYEYTILNIYLFHCTVETFHYGYQHWKRAYSYSASCFRVESIIYKWPRGVLLVGRLVGLSVSLYI